MSENSNLGDDFVLVSRKRKTNKPTYSNTGKINSDTFTEKSSISQIVKKIKDAQDEFLNSNAFHSFKALIVESLTILGNPKIGEIVCFGLGSIGECIAPRYQIALLLYLKDYFKADTYVYDPIYSEYENNILKELGCKVLENNTEGKHTVKANISTIYYLPHCPKQLTNNLLWTNWGLNLSSCIIIANSFRQIVENNTNRYLANNAYYLTTISPYTTELTVINEFKYYDIFNDTAIHIFPLEKLSLLPSDFWDNCEEPKYECKDIEFISNKLSKNFKEHGNN